MHRRPLLAALTALALAGAGAGCGEAGSPAGDRPDLRVLAATSLKPALGDGAPWFREARVRLSFAGSDELAAQVRRGVAVDLFLAANATLPDALAAEGLVERPVAFTANELVLAVPARDARVTTLADLETPGVRLAVGADGVPVGDYTRTVLGRLAPAARRAIQSNVRSREPDVGGVSAKVARGAADAGFVYRTDVRASGGRLRAITLPARLRPAVGYEGAVVRDARRPQLARSLLRRLARGDGQAVLRRAGFSATPG